MKLGYRSRVQGEQNKQPATRGGCKTNKKQAKQNFNIPQTYSGFGLTGCSSSTIGLSSTISRASMQLSIFGGNIFENCLTRKLAEG